MPQGRRKVPFSGKKKKEQLILKRQTKAKAYSKKPQNESDDDDETESPAENIQKLNYQTSTSSRSNANRYALQFHKETKKELSVMKEQAGQPFDHVPENEREIDSKYFESYDFPIRPEWNYNTTKEELDRNENRYFTAYVQKLEKRHVEANKVLSLFELNLETWRQLWRVLELSDILLIVVDVRFSALMFPPALHTYITKTLKKNMIIILNKIDLVTPDIVVAWKNYFTQTYPDISVVLFASYPISRSDNLNSRKRKTSVKIATEGVYAIFKECQSIVGNDLNLSAWEQKILEDLKDEIQQQESDEDNDEGGASSTVRTHKENYDFDFEMHTKYKNGVLTIGCIGFPNVGKSSLINALKGRKVVSVSRTPGHTKHFQTIFLTENVKLCDCPGLVFPSSTPKYIQVLLGSYPIAQLREPYNSIKYLGERIDLPKILLLQLPPDFNEWSAIAVCEAWAIKRGFITAKAARPDHYRAANNLLRMVLAGRITFEFYPPDFFQNREKWLQHPELETVKKLQGERKSDISVENLNLAISEPSDDDEGVNNNSELDSENSEFEDNVVLKTSNTFDVLGEE